MPPIDYSKWDNIDTDSEPETSPQQAPAAKPPAAHACLAADGYVRFEETHSKSGHVEAVIVRCEAEKRKFPLWSATTIPANHDMFSQSVPSVPALIEVPLVLYRTGTQSVNEADLDNQIATYLNIDADSGFAPQNGSHKLAPSWSRARTGGHFIRSILKECGCSATTSWTCSGKETGRRDGFTAARRSRNGG
ncbi:uncharacterized protein HRG_11803 [Hirsutella rhossiliensis]|uniref:Uncharacterized protein n=1 Tax=Hirsutella rhossiliensis TaxID=111463 RepID=A0A9P8MMS1_9HYPO|nr:uncharacterized protein HRG_11803 [Hirsutella rhossiliensis]KAH0957254.1 hypothetical protein HRG_11803 [Hirsutella rhossiliensis]